MENQEMDNIGTRLRKLRKDLGMNQEDWAKLLQVSTNTVARWERGEFSPTGVHKKKAEQMLKIVKDKKAKEVLRKTLASEGGLAATAAFTGMLFGVMGVLDVGMSALSPMLKSGSSLLKGIEDYTKRQNGV